MTTCKTRDIPTLFDNMQKSLATLNSSASFVACRHYPTDLLHDARALTDPSNRNRPFFYLVTVFGTHLVWLDKEGGRLPVTLPNTLKYLLFSYHSELPRGTYICEQGNSELLHLSSPEMLCEYLNKYIELSWCRLELKEFNHVTIT